MNTTQAEAFLERMYVYALNKSNQKQINWIQYNKYVQKQLKTSKIPYEKIKPLTLQSKNDWIEDLLEITRNLKLVKEKKPFFYEKLHTRASMHFSSGHYDNLIKIANKSNAAKKVLEMYNKSQLKQWNQQKLPQLTDFILQNTFQILGLTKGNGVLLEQEYLMTCAHAFMDEESKIVRYRCFATGNGTYGIVKINSNGVFIDEDIGFARIIKIFEVQKKSKPFYLNVPKSLKFGKQFEHIRCIQVGLILNNDYQPTQTLLFQTSQGFIQRNLYQDNNDHRLVEEMGLLVHDCYGLWGTSGSPLWTSEGQLLGIHNAWNEKAFNVSMIVHDNDSSDCRVVGQYERRAIGIHVIFQLFQKWKKIIKQEESKSNNQIKAQQQHSAKTKKVKK